MASGESNKKLNNLKRRDDKARKMTWIFGWMLKGIGRRGTKVFVVLVGVMLLDRCSSARAWQRKQTLIMSLLSSPQVAEHTPFSLGSTPIPTGTNIKRTDPFPLPQSTELSPSPNAV